MHSTVVTNSETRNHHNVTMIHPTYPNTVYKQSTTIRKYHFGNIFIIIIIILNRRNTALHIAVYVFFCLLTVKAISKERKWTNKGIKLYRWLAQITQDSMTDRKQFRRHSHQAFSLFFGIKLVCNKNLSYLTNTEICISSKSSWHK